MGRKRVVPRDDHSTDDAPPAIARPRWLGETSRKTVSPEDLREAAEVIKDDPSHAKNGWTPETLAAYFKERKGAQSDTVFHRRPSRPLRTKGWHNPHRWRR